MLKPALEKLRSCYGQTSPEPLLRYLKFNFSASYLAQVESKASKPFVTTFENGAPLVRTYAEFHRDVLTILTGLSQAEPSGYIVRAKNRYRDLVVLTAVLLSRHTLVLINPDEAGPDLDKKLSALPRDFRLLDIDPLFSAPAQVVASLIEPIRELKNSMVQVFTSGSTGFGKVVDLSERNILANIEAVIRHHELWKGKKIATPLPVFHVNAFFFSFLASLLAGGELLLLDSFQPLLISEQLAGQGVDLLSLVPTAIRLLVKAANWIEVRVISDLNYVVSAASYLDPQLLNDFYRIFSCRIIQGFGLSEAVNFSTTFPIDLHGEKYLSTAIRGRETSIGVELFGNQLSIVNEVGSLLDEEQIGEVVIQGFSVMNGYRDDHDEACFAGGTFHTGDLGYFKVIGGARHFFICGRIKDVLKRGGVTLSLREVDGVIQPLALGQLDCVAFPIASPTLGEDLGIAIRFETMANLDPLSLSATVSTAISKLLRPKVIVITTTALRTPSGKPIRHRLTKAFGEFQTKERPMPPNDQILILLEDDRGWTKFIPVDKN